MTHGAIAGAVSEATPASGHTFHIPVMGIGFTLDTPLKVARYGIGSCMSLVDDVLIERLREHYCRRRGRPFAAISRDLPDARARRITAYLDLVDDLVHEQLADLLGTTLDDPQGLGRYLRLLPAQAPLSALHARWQKAPPGERAALEREIRRGICLGPIEVNIMTKLDRADDKKGRPRALGESDALAAARGFAESRLAGALVLSAGLNQKLFGYLAELAVFRPDEAGRFRKRLVLKVSDLRSALVQGKLLARKGLWVSEYRIESGLNCGGHAFPTEGHLLGPILEDFKRQREELGRGFFDVYAAALRQRGCPVPPTVPAVRVTVQGGIGTALEDRFLREHYGVDRTGWGSPFLMVPEVTAVDEATLAKLIAARETDVRLTWASPLGIRFWSLVTAESHLEREERERRARPGSACPKGFLALNHEFGVPLCRASRAFQKAKLAELEATLSPSEYTLRAGRVTEVCCICHDLGGSLTRKYGLGKAAPPSICPGPNVLNFQRRLSLEDLVDHIYGRTNVLTRPDRPHQFTKELELYLDHLSEQIGELGGARSDTARLENFIENLERGIEYYGALVRALPAEVRVAFAGELAAARQRFEALKARHNVAVGAAPAERYPLCEPLGPI